MAQIYETQTPPNIGIDVQNIMPSQKVLIAVSNVPFNPEVNPLDGKADLLTSIQSYTAAGDFCIGQVARAPDPRHRHRNDDRTNDLQTTIVISRIYRNPEGKIQIESSTPMFAVYSIEELHAVPLEELNDDFIAQQTNYESRFKGYEESSGALGTHIERYRQLESARNELVKQLQELRLQTNGDVPEKLAFGVANDLFDRWQGAHGDMPLKDFLQLYYHKVFHPNNRASIDPRLVLQATGKLVTLGRRDEESIPAGCSMIAQIYDVMPDKAAEFFLPFFTDSIGQVSEQYLDADVQWYQVANTLGWPLASVSREKRHAIIAQYRLQIQSATAIQPV